MLVKIKRVDKDLPLPEYQTDGAVAFDLYSRIDTEVPPKSVALVPLNVIIATPPGYMLFIKDRSGLAKRKGLIATAGIVDQDYCGEEDELRTSLYNPGEEAVKIERGERLVQGIFIEIEKAEWEEVETMSKKSRGGFGTTG